MSDSSRAQVRYLAESAWGTTPASAMTNLNVTSESLGQNTDTTNSQIIRSDTNIADIIRTNVSAAGDVGIELMYGGYDALLEGAFRSTWATPVAISATTISAAAADNSFNDSGTGFVSGNILAGMFLRVAGFATAANNGYFKVVSVTAGKIIVTGGTLVNESATPTITMKGAMLKNGTTAKSFTLEKEFSDVTEFVSFAGMRVASFSLTAAPGAILGGNFSFVGIRAVAAGATVGTGAANAAAVTNVMNAVDNVTAIREGGVTSTLDLTELSFTINTNPRAQNAIGTLGAVGIGTGTIQVQGTFNAYYESRAIFNKHLNFTETSLSFVTVDAAGNAYVWDFPTVNITSGNPVAGGIDTDVIAQLSWQAAYNSTHGLTCSVTRIPA